MYSLIGLNPEEIVALKGRRVLTHGAEPEWVRRGAEVERELPLLRAEQRAAVRAQEGRSGLVARLRLAFGRA